MNNEQVDLLLAQAVREAEPNELYKYRFAKLVAAHEREACAQACENDDWRVAASVVRARGARPAPEPTERDWQGLSTAETKALWAAAEKKPSSYAAMIEAKLKEKNI